MDALEGVERKIDILDYGFVELVDCSPRLVTEGRTIEDAIVEGARISYQGCHKSATADAKLVEYLIRHRHTSPIEHVNFRFRIKVPKAIAIHILRHRTFRPNEESQRYCRIEPQFYHPSSGIGVRTQSKSNKQASVPVDDEAMKQSLVKAEELMDQVFEVYQELLDQGVAREVARFFLPMATYTTMIISADLHNLLNFIRLRDDSHAQLEIQLVAQAIVKLITPLVPNVMKVFNDMRHGISLSESELTAIQNNTALETASISANSEFKAKLTTLGIN